MLVCWCSPSVNPLYKHPLFKPSFRLPLYADQMKCEPCERLCHLLITSPARSVERKARGVGPASGPLQPRVGTPDLRIPATPFAPVPTEYG